MTDSAERDSSRLQLDIFLEVRLGRNVGLNQILHSFFSHRCKNNMLCYGAALFWGGRGARRIVPFSAIVQLFSYWTVSFLIILQNSIAQDSICNITQVIPLLSKHECRFLSRELVLAHSAMLFLRHFHDRYYAPAPHYRIHNMCVSFDINTAESVA